MSKTIVVFGAGGHAKAVIDTIERQGQYDIAGLLDGRQPIGSRVYGYEVLGDDKWLQNHTASLAGAIVAIGDNWTRGLVVHGLKTAYPNLTFIKAVHPSAQIARGARIGAGSVVMAGAVLGSDASIGEHSIVYPLSSIDHDSKVGDFVSFAPRSVTGGNVSVGDYTAMAIGSVAIHGVAIGQHCVIGAGATVLSDIPSHTVAYGTPAVPIRSRNSGDRYL